MRARPACAERCRLQASTTSLPWWPARCPARPAPRSSANQCCPLGRHAARTLSQRRSAGCNRRRVDPDPRGVIGMRDEPCSLPPFPRPAWCGFL